MYRSSFFRSTGKPHNSRDRSDDFCVQIFTLRILWNIDELYEHDRLKNLLGPEKGGEITSVRGGKKTPVGGWFGF